MLFTSTIINIKSLFSNVSQMLVREYHRKLTRTTGHGFNVHRSNRAKKGLFHGKDVRSGHRISHSKVHSKRKFYPNVINKRVWTYALNDWVRFKMTTTALKAMDDYGGIDNYVMHLDEASVQDSNYIIKMRGLISAALFHKGKLSGLMSHKLGYDLAPPEVPIYADKRRVKNEQEYAEREALKLKNSTIKH